MDCVYGIPTFNFAEETRHSFFSLVNLEVNLVFDLKNSMSLIFYKKSTFEPL